MTKSPCYRDGHDCDKRHVGCRATCDKWQKWVEIHEQERTDRRKKRLAEIDVNTFVMLQGKRIRATEQERSDRKRRGERRTKMKTTTIDLNIYEIGDVIMIPRKDISLESKRRTIETSSRALVVGVTQRADKLYSYRLLAQNGKTITLKPNEQGGEQYVGHIDMSMLYTE